MVVVGGEVGEVLHVDLQGGGGDAVAVVVVDPGACWLASELAMRRCNFLGPGEGGGDVICDSLGL